MKITVTREMFHAALREDSSVEWTYAQIEGLWDLLKDTDTELDVIDLRCNWRGFSSLSDLLDEYDGQTGSIEALRRKTKIIACANGHYLVKAF